MTIITEAAEVAEVEPVLKSSLSLIKWRLKPHSWRRLHIDVVALCSGMRPVVMVDYGGKLPELQSNLCGMLAHAQNVSPIFQQLRIMIIEDMIYMVNIDEFAEYISWTLNFGGAKQFFVDLEKDPLKMITGACEYTVVVQLLLIQKLFSSIFGGSGVNYNNIPLQHPMNDSTDIGKTSTSLPVSSKFSEVIDLSSCLHGSEVTIPTLNGWLLYYPVIYLFGKDCITDAVYNLSTKSLRIFKVLVSRSGGDNDQSPLEELMSFTVPFDLSMEGRDEPWSIEFWHRIQAKWERCKNAWSSVRMEVTQCYPQAIVL